LFITCEIVLFVRFGYYYYLLCLSLVRLCVFFSVAFQILSHFISRATGALKTKDITIRRECVQILYMICNKSSVSKIVGELLSYLQVRFFNSSILHFFVAVVVVQYFNFTLFFLR
jgi:hypothetical protein